MRLAPVLVLALFLLLLAGCGGDDDSPTSSDRTTSAPSGATTPTPTPTPTPAEVEPGAVTAEILGDAGAFVTGGSGATEVPVEVDGRECVLAQALPLTCRAATGAGGGFVVTAEGVADAPGDFNVVVRCGLDPSLPAASASGDFQPLTADLGIAPYGEVVGITLIGSDRVEASLVYLPEGSACPVVWGLGETDRSSLFTGGIDALNGEESPVLFLDGTGTQACAVADGQGGIRVGSPQGRGCA